MNETTINKLKRSFIIDLGKPNISKFERSELIRDYIKDNNMSMQEFCDEFSFKRATVYNWLQWGDLGENNYQKLKEGGLSESDITNLLNRTDITTDGKIRKLCFTTSTILSKKNLNLKNETIEKLKELEIKIRYVLFREGKRMKYDV